MPLGVTVAHQPGRHEAVANGDHGAPLGRELEIANLLSTLKARRVRNVVWITGDVHYCAAHHYDPARAAVQGFRSVLGVHRRSGARRDVRARRARSHVRSRGAFQRDAGGPEAQPATQCGPAILRAARRRSANAGADGVDRQHRRRSACSRSASRLRDEIDALAAGAVRAVDAGDADRSRRRRCRCRDHRRRVLSLQSNRSTTPTWRAVPRTRESAALGPRIRRGRQRDFRERLRGSPARSRRRGSSASSRPGDPGNCVRIPQSSDCSATTRLHDSLLSGLDRMRAIGPDDTRRSSSPALSTRLDLRDHRRRRASTIRTTASVAVSRQPAGVDVHRSSVAPRVAIDSARVCLHRSQRRNIRDSASARMCLRVRGGVRVRLN